MAQIAHQAPTAELTRVGGAFAEAHRSLPDWAHAPLLLAVPAVAALVVQQLVWRLLSRRAGRDERPRAWGKLVSHTRWPAGVLATMAGASLSVSLGVQPLRPMLGAAPGWSEWFIVLVTLALTWTVVALIAGADDMILARYRMDVRDNLKARRMHTQVAVISRTIQLIAALIGIGLALMNFEGVRQLGTSLLASAGIAGVVVGFAARPVLGNLIAGVQIALTQPIRLDDAVIIEGEWGWIEEITSTYVVVKIWDERRLIVPFSTIIEQPFQNWTRRTAEIIGTVTLHVDYTCDVEILRRQLTTLLKANELWDGRVNVLHVTDAGDRTLTLRALVSASDSPTAWDLRCEIREQLIAFLRREHREWLPHERELQGSLDADRPEPSDVD